MHTFSIRSGRVRGSLVLTLAFWAALTLGAATAEAANPPGRNAARTAPDQSSRAWIRSGLVFAAVSLIGGYAWYFGFFPRMLRKQGPSWPLDAWRLATYGAWITICLAALAFRNIRRRRRVK